MDLTSFRFITELPEVINNEVWYELAVRAYNLGLTFVWFTIFYFAFDVIFTSFSKLYKRGHD